MKIVEVIASNLTIPYEVPYRPAWQPGIVRNSRDFTLVRIRSDEGLTGMPAAMATRRETSAPT